MPDQGVKRLATALAIKVIAVAVVPGMREGSWQGHVDVSTRGALSCGRVAACGLRAGV